VTVAISQSVVKLEDSRKETGGRRQEAGGRRQEAGGRRQESRVVKLEVYRQKASSLNFSRSGLLLFAPHRRN
jgi:hypothetical protein